MFGNVLKLLLLKDLKTTFRQKKHFITEIILLFVIVPGFISLNVLTSKVLYNSHQIKNETQVPIIVPLMNLTTTSEPWNSTTSEPWNSTTSESWNSTTSEPWNSTTFQPWNSTTSQNSTPSQPWNSTTSLNSTTSDSWNSTSEITESDLNITEMFSTTTTVSLTSILNSEASTSKSEHAKIYETFLETEHLEGKINVSIQNTTKMFKKYLLLTCGNVLNIIDEQKDNMTLPNVTVKIAKFDTNAPSFEYKLILHDHDNLGWHNEPYMIPDLFGVPFPPINFSYSDSFAATWTQHCLDIAFYHQFKSADNDKHAAIEPPVTIVFEHGPEPAQSEESYTHGFLMLLFEIIIPILISIPTLITGHELCEEKENNIHTFMVVMGLDRSLCILSHLIFAIIKMYIYVLPIGITVIVCFDDVGWYIFLLLFLYSHVYISSIFLILSLTKKTTVVIFVTSSVVVFGLLSAYIIPTTIFEIVPVSILSFLIPHMAFRYGLNHLTKVVIYHQEINFFAAPIYMPLWIPIFSLLFQSIFILILAFYFDAVIPIDDSPKKHPLFMFGMKYDDISESVKESELESLILEASQKSISAFSEFYFENDKNQMVAEIDVFHLSKKWSNNRFGVQDITFKAYQNQVTSILGHNGAGKSTTFSILAGFTKSSSGKVFVCGKEPRNLCQTSAVGYCPQWDPLFPHLDVREHLKFYQSLKGENNPEEIEEMIEKLGLNDFVYYRAKFLSGGMRRKLSVGMAMIGNSRVIILDEPMVGMDTLSRKQLVEIIRAAKSEHTILLATHYMDVADDVSDRIIILSNGKIVCNGSSNFLKANVETGFLLTVEFTRAIGMESYQQFADVVLSIVTKHCKNASIDGSANRQFTIFLPRGTQRSFPLIFNELETQKDALQIDSYDIRANTLEQVFIKVTDEVESNKQKNANEIVKEFVEKRDGAYTGCRLILSQLSGLLMRKHHYTRRHYIRSLIPHGIVLLFLVYFFIALYGPEEHFQKDQGTAIENYPAMTVLLYTRDEQNCYNNIRNRFSKNVNLINEQYNHIHLRNYEEMIYSKIPLTFSIVLSAENHVTIIYRAPFPNGAAVALNLLGNSLFDRKDVIKTTISIEAIGHKKKASSGLMLCFFMIFPVAFMITIYLHVEESDNGIVHLYERTQMKLITYWLASFIFDFIYAMIPICFVTFVTLAFGDGMLLKIECWYVLLPGMLLIVLVFLLQAYVFSSFFTSSTLAVITFLIYNIVFSSITFVVLYGIQREDLLYVSIFFPVIAINMLVASKGSKYKNSIFSFCPGDAENPPCLGTVFAIIFGNLLFYLIVLLICIYRRRCFSSCETSRADLTPYKENEDFLEERRNVENLGPDAFQIYTSNIRKTYSGLVAVRDITMGVQKGECFGLLGANGAGKTTFFNILTALMPPSCGYGCVGGIDIRKQPLFGFCPQKSHLIIELTVEETLYLFARLNGIKLKEEVIEIICESFYFNKIKDTLVERISGGELRRLSIAIALITSSEILMLDEPTTGVDPRTRRHIWNLLISLRSNGGSSQLLTSHSMEECEALCTKIGFINHGIFIGIGTLQHIKNRFGNTHRLIITLNSPNKILAQKLNTEIQSTFNATPISVTGNVPDLCWSIPKSSGPLSQLYTRLIQFVDCQKMNETGETSIKDFAITGTSLEEVFATMVDTKIKYEFRF